MNWLAVVELVVGAYVGTYLGLWMRDRKNRRG